MELKWLASTCNFGSLNDRLIRDKRVCGISDKSLWKSSLARKDLKLPEYTELCKTSQTSSERAKQITTTSSTVTAEATYGHQIKKEEVDIHVMSTTHYTEGQRRGVGRTDHKEPRITTFGATALSLLWVRCAWPTTTLPGVW